MPISIIPPQIHTIETGYTPLRDEFFACYYGNVNVTTIKREDEDLPDPLSLKRMKTELEKKAKESAGTIHSVYTVNEVNGKITALDNKITGLSTSTSAANVTLRESIKTWASTRFSTKADLTTTDTNLKQLIEQKIKDVITSINTLPLPPTAEELSNQITDIMTTLIEERLSPMNTAIEEIQRKLAEMDNSPGE